MKHLRICLGIVRGTCPPLATPFYPLLGFRVFLPPYPVIKGDDRQLALPHSPEYKVQGLSWGLVLPGICSICDYLLNKNLHQASKEQCLRIEEKIVFSLY